MKLAELDEKGQEMNATYSKLLVCIILYMSCMCSVIN